MSHLYIIGNGFDLHHRVESGYDHFAHWLRKHDRQLFDTYRRVCRYDALWQDFERGMAYVDRSYFLDMSAPFLPDLTDRDPDDLTGADIFLAGDWGNDYAVDLVTRLKKRFAQWIRSIKVPSDYDDKMVELDRDARFFSFNYTDFLESRYKIAPGRVMHIHGLASDQKSQLIVGHGEDSDAIFDAWHKRICRRRPIINRHGKKIWIPSPYLKYYQEPTCYLPEYESLTEKIEVYYEEAEKPVMKIIESRYDYFRSLNDVNKVTVLGFSFSTVDLPYIQALLSVNNGRGIDWHIGCHTDQDKLMATKRLESISVKVDDDNFFEF